MGSSRSNSYSSENVSFASESDTLEQVVDTSTFIIGEVDNEKRNAKLNNEDIKSSSDTDINVSDSDSSSSGGGDGTSSSVTSSSDSSDGVEEQMNDTKNHKSSINVDLKLGKTNIKIEDDVLSVFSMNEEQNDVQNDIQDDSTKIENEMKKLSM